MRESTLAMDRTLLIVDDEENLLLLLDRILSKEGYAVSTAPNNYQTLRLLENGRFQLAILDIKMFPIDGLALLAEIKNRCPTIPVIMVTAYPTPDSRNESFRKGATSYLTKPLDIQQLKNVVRTLVPA
jgi:DNA-binding NtrC family response regulator